MSRRGRRTLRPEEEELWRRVAESVERLKPRRGTRKLKVAKDAAGEPPPEPAVRAPVPGPVEPPKPPAAAKTPPAKPVAAPAGPKPPPLAPLERRTVQRLVRGTHAIDDRLDLHGLTQDAAKRRLMDFLHRAQANGLKTVLVITGKGALGTDRFEAGDFTAERGVLRRMVPEWLRMPGARGLVVGFSEAHAAHGGSGALYVRIRRPKTGR